MRQGRLRELKGLARSRCFLSFCFILLVMSPKCQIGRARVFLFLESRHITTENYFPAVYMTFSYKLI